MVAETRSATQLSLPNLSRQGLTRSISRPSMFASETMLVTASALMFPSIPHPMVSPDQKSRIWLPIQISIFTKSSITRIDLLDSLLLIPSTSSLYQAIRAAEDQFGSSIRMYHHQHSRHRQRSPHLIQIMQDQHGQQHQIRTTTWLLQLLHMNQPQPRFRYPFLTLYSLTPFLQ